MQSGSHNLNGRQIFEIGTVHFGTDVTDVFFNLPNAFARTPLTSEKTDVTGVRLRVVRTNQAEQCRFTGTVFSTQCPLFTPADCPVELLQDSAVIITNTYLI